MELLLPDQLKEAWRKVEAQSLSPEQFDEAQKKWKAEYRQIWQKALLMRGQASLKESLLAEIQAFTGEPARQVEDRCRGAVTAIASEWSERVKKVDSGSVEQFYDQSENYIYDLMWWHTLEEDDSPLGYVTALDFALRNGCRHCLDYGTGVGSGALLFERNGFRVTLADISSTLLNFCRWRFEQRGLTARFIDVKTEPLPVGEFDIITAMDVMEHLVDPVETLSHLHSALKPGGFLFGRFAAEASDTHPQHIVVDFGPTFAQLEALGFKEVWRDQWLWGHQVFQKPVEN